MKWVIGILLLGIFVVVNLLIEHGGRKDNIDPFKYTEQERMPDSIQGSGKRIFNHINPFSLSSAKPFSPGLYITFSELITPAGAWLRTTALIWHNGSPDSLACSLVTTCNQQGTNYKYIYLPLEKMKLPSRQWSRVTLDYRIPRGARPDDIIQSYFWFRGKGEMRVDDMQVSIYEAGTIFQGTTTKH